MAKFLATWRESAWTLASILCRKMFKWQGLVLSLYSRGRTQINNSGQGSQLPFLISPTISLSLSVQLFLSSGFWSPFTHSASSVPGLLEEYPLERSPEVLVENCVDDGVERGVGVAQPEGEWKSPPVDTYAGPVLLAQTELGVTGVVSTLFFFCTVWLFTMHGFFTKIQDTKLWSILIILKDNTTNTNRSTNLYASLWFRTKDAAELRWHHQPLQCWLLLKAGLKG